MPPNGCTPFPSTVVDEISVVLAAQLLGECRCRSIKIVPHIRSNEAEAFAHTSSIALELIALIKTIVRSFLIAASSFWIIVAASVSTSAQTISESQMRAANLARMQAELINAGGSQYSPANCMHQGGGGTCMISNTAEGFRFRFLGGAPGWAARNDPATIETVILVSSDGKLSKVEYNGPVRSSMITP